MTIKIEASEDIDCPVDVVFKFFANDHVLNHPRWDPYIELSSDSDEPMGIGRIIRRRNRRSGVPVEGTMQVVEYEPNQAFGMITREGPMEIRGRATFEEIGAHRTRLTLTAELPVDESMKEVITASVLQSLTNIKELVERENAVA